MQPTHCLHIGSEEDASEIVGEGKRKGRGMRKKGRDKRKEKYRKKGVWVGKDSLGLLKWRME